MNKKILIICVTIALAISGGVIYAQETGLLQINSSTNVVTPAELTSTPATLTFGTVVQGQSTQKTSVITNTGDTSTTILEVTTEGLATGLTLTNDLPALLDAGQSATVTWTLTAAEDATTGVNNFAIVVDEAS